MSSSPRQQIPQQQKQEHLPTFSSQVVDAYEQDGKHYVEVWLIDPTWNKNYWKANQDELTKKVQRFVNKPAILTPYLFHPHEYEHVQEDPFDPEGNVRKHNAIDERYRIGHITHVKPLPNAAYAGIIELTHPGAIEAFKAGKIPKFVSPAVYNLNMTGPQGEFTSFEPLHIAFVDQPAFGLKARIIDTCHGKEDLCLRNLGVAAAVMGESCIHKALEKLENRYEPAHSSHMKSSASVASELSVKEDSASKPVAATIQDKDKEKEQLPVQSTNNKKPEAPQSKAPVKAETEEVEKEEKDDNNNNNKPKDKDSKDKAAVVGKEEIATVLESLKDYVKTQISESLQVYIEETRKEQEKTAAKEAKRKLIESYVTLESAGGSKEERDRRIGALMHIPRDDLETFLEAHYKIAGKSRSNAAKASKISDFNRGMQQNAPNNVGTAALLLDQDTNDRIDRVLSIGRFVPSARIVPNTEREGVTA